MARVKLTSARSSSARISSRRSPGALVRETSTTWRARDFWANDRQQSEKHGESADDLWTARQPMERELRQELWARYRIIEADERGRRWISADATLAHPAQASVDRAAIRRALEGLHLIQYRRLRMSPPFSALLATGNS